MNVYVGIRLPSEYQEVEYIQSSGTQYINTGYILTSNPKFDIDFAFLGGDSNSWIPIYGARNNYTNSSDHSGFFCLYVNSNSKYVTPNYAGFDPGTASGLTINSNVKYNMVQDGGQFYVDGVYKSDCSTTNTYTSVVGRNFLLFANNNNDGIVQIRNCQMKLYGCKLYNNGTLVRDFVPCYRKSDSVIGLYDLANNQFYTNSGTGTFSKGSDVLTNATLKNAYIGEYPQVPTDGMLVYYPLTSDANDHKADLGVSGTTYNGTWGGTANYGTVGGKTGALFSRGSNRINTGFSRSSAPITICAYVYETNPVQSDWQTAIGNPSGNNQNGYAIRLVGTNNSVRFNNGTGSDKTVSNMSSNEWHSLILTIKSGESKLYIDGVLAYTDSTGSNASGGSFYIASYGTYTTYGFNGYIRNVAIYNRVLSADEAMAYNDYFK